MTGSPYLTTLADTATTITAAGNDASGATPINSVLQYVNGSGGILLPTDQTNFTGYGDNSNVNPQAVTLISATDTDVNVYAVDGSVRTILSAGTSCRLEPGGSDSWALIKLY